MLIFSTEEKVVGVRCLDFLQMTGGWSKMLRFSTEEEVVGVRC